MASKHMQGHASANGRPRVASSILAVLFAALRSAAGNFSIIDLSLPLGQCAGVDRDAIFGCGSELPPVSQQFLSRFRQSGGHREIYQAVAGGQETPTWESLLDAVDRARKAVVFCDSPEQADAVLGLVDDDRSLVVRVSDPGTAPTTPAMESWLARRRIIAFTSSDGGFLWFVPREAFETVRRAIPLDPAPQAGRPAKAAGPRATGASPRPDATFVLPQATSTTPSTELAASALVHDGGYRSESEGDYSWVWTGPANHFRVLLTGAPAVAAKLSISIIKTEDARNLAGLRVLVDGRHVPHRFDAWTDLSGKVTIKLGVPRDDMTVLSLVCPHMVPDAAGHRVLGLCIDKIEMTP